MVTCSVQFKFINSENESLKTKIYIIPQTVPGLLTGSLVSGDGISLIIEDSIVPLIPALYYIRTLDCNFNLNLVGAPTGSVIQASDYIV